MLFRLLIRMLKSGRKLVLLRYGLVCLFLAMFSFKGAAQNELPAYLTANLQTIKTGSLIIAMDTILQSKPGYFNLKAYGLVNALLQNEIPVKWVIKKGKAKNGTDFSTTSLGVTRIFPDTLTLASVTSFNSGPFIIDSSWVSAALPIISSYGGNVSVYKLNANAINVDVRYTLSFIPRIAVLNSSSSSGADTIIRYQLQEAGFYSWNYTLFTPINTIFNQNTVYSLLADTHIAATDTAHANPIKRYVKYGSNFFVQCAALGAYENIDTMLTTKGVDSLSSGASFVYSNNDLPIAQFHGTISNPWGEYQNWKLKTGSVMNTTYAYDVISRTGGIHFLSAAKLKTPAEKGGNIYYLCSHDYYYPNSTPYTPNQNNKINGRRVFMNSIFVPPSDTIGLDFRTELKLKMTACPGLPVKNESFCMNFVISNNGYRAKNVKVVAPFPAALSYSSVSMTKGTYNSGTGIWSIDSVMKGESDTLKLTVIINQLGNITYAGTTNSSSYEEVTLNNNDTIKLFAVSRPVALDDTCNFNGPFVVTTNTKTNDSDEDGGPFGNSSIITPPANGTAIVISNDSIRYSPVASFTGLDSLQYSTCDNYGLCDSGWLFINVLSPLPVTLSHFSGNRSSGLIALEWTTLSESANDFFNIEKSIDGKRFNSEGKVKGSGTSTMIHHYDFMEADTWEPVIYYRLKQFDFNGAYNYSPTIALPLKGKGKLSINVYPNPIGKGNELDIHLTGLSEGKDVLKITDLTGRIVFRKQFVHQDSNTIDEFINTSEFLESGCYIVSLVSNNEVAGVKLIVK